jgi:hypothetical protein
MADTPYVFTGEVITAMQGYASSAYSTARSAIGALSSAININIPTMPSAPSLSPMAEPKLPTLTGAAPSAETAPSVPSIGTFSAPPSPSYSMPSVPTMSVFAIPEYIPGEIAGITTSIPVNDITVPSISSIDVTETAQDSLFGAIRDKLETNILDGGTMLDPTVEADIWNRDLERQEQALQDIIDKTTTQWAKLGWSLPDGLLAGQILAINNEYINKRLDRSREISVKQAELEHTGLFKSLELGVNFEQIVTASANEFAKRRLDGAKINMDILVEVFKTKVMLYNSNLEAFKADVEVYKASIQAEMANAEVYKSKISALMALAQLDESKVKVYTAQIAAIGQMVDMYNTQVKAVATMYEAEKIKIESYKAQVEAYATSTDAATKRYVGSVQAYSAEIQGVTAIAEASNKNIEVQGRVAIAQYEASIKLMETTARMTEAEANLKMEGLKAAAQSSSNLAAGAMAAIHASVSDSFNSSQSTARNYSYMGT